MTAVGTCPSGRRLCARSLQKLLLRASASIHDRVPIRSDRFEELDSESPPPSKTNAHEILSFLEVNADQAFRLSEIAEAIDLDLGVVGSTLVCLREDGRVDHRGTYWRISDHVRSVDAAVEQAAAAAASRESSSFDREEWRRHAVDPREHRE